MIIPGALWRDLQFFAPGRAIGENPGATAAKQDSISL
jgi:hypothetical protein